MLARAISFGGRHVDRELNSVHSVQQQNAPSETDVTAAASVVLSLPSPMTLAPGTVVQLSGLQSQPALNGLSGVVVGPESAGRVPVLLYAPGSQPTKILVKPLNATATTTLPPDPLMAEQVMRSLQALLEQDVFDPATHAAKVLAADMLASVAHAVRTHAADSAGILNIACRLANSMTFSAGPNVGGPGYDASIFWKMVQSGLCADVAAAMRLQGRSQNADLQYVGLGFLCNFLAGFDPDPQYDDCRPAPLEVAIRTAAKEANVLSLALGALISHKVDWRVVQAGIGILTVWTKGDGGIDALNEVHDAGFMPLIVKLLAKHRNNESAVQTITTLLCNLVGPLVDDPTRVLLPDNVARMEVRPAAERCCAALRDVGAYDVMQGIVTRNKSLLDDMTAHGGPSFEFVSSIVAQLE